MYLCNRYERGSSSVGRAWASQAQGRGFEPRLPLIVLLTRKYHYPKPVIRLLHARDRFGIILSNASPDFLYRASFRGYGDAILQYPIFQILGLVYNGKRAECFQFRTGAEAPGDGNGINAGIDGGLHVDT